MSVGINRKATMFCFYFFICNHLNPLNRDGMNMGIRKSEMVCIFEIYFMSCTRITVRTHFL